MAVQFSFTSKKYLFATIVVIIIGLLIISACSEDSKNPVKDDEDEIFIKPVVPADVIKLENGARVVGNNILLHVDSEDLDTEAVEAIVSQYGGELVGQIPGLGMYQVEFEFSTESELNAKIAELTSQQSIDRAGYNHILQKRSEIYCERDYDNYELSNIHKIPFTEIGYYPAVPLMGYVMENMELSPVKVAVFDSEVANDFTSEFDNLNLYIMDEETNEIYFNDDHGTQVAGIIGADNMDEGVNGLASSLIGENLELYSYVNDTLATVIEDIGRLYTAYFSDKIEIVNMSYGCGRIDEDTGIPVIVTDARADYKTAFSTMSDVLFICAAANENYEITTTNDAPAGIQLPNVITVAGTKYNSPREACTWSSYGTLMDVGAPCEDIPVVHPTQAHGVVMNDGNSFGTPMVVSLAAILKSINPDLSPVEIKNYILDYSLETDISVGGNRLYFPTSIMQLLIDMDVDEAIMEKIDVTDPLGEFDNPGVVECRICSEANFTVSGEPKIFVETDSSGLGLLNEMGGALTYHNEIQTVEIGINTYDILTGPLPILNEDEQPPNSVTVSYVNIDNGVVGNAVSGSFSIENAYVTQYNPINQAPMIMTIEGTLYGTMELVVGEDIVERTFEGNIFFPIMLMGTSEDFLSYFEEKAG